LGFAITLRRKGIPLVAEFPWKISIVGAMAYPRMAQGGSAATEDLLKILQDSFFDAVEVPAIEFPNWNQVLQQLGETTLVRSLQSYIITNGLDFSSSDSAKRQEAIGKIRNEIDSAAYHGMKMVGICSGPDVGAAERRKAKENLVQSLIEICQHGFQRNVMVALETFDREWDKKLLVGPLDEAAEIVAEVRKKCPNIGLMWDLSHAPMLNETPAVLKRWPSLLKHIHVGCAKRIDGKYLDTHPGFNTNGAVNSEEDVASLLKVLLDIDYQGMVGFEVKPEPQQTSETIVTTAKGVLAGAYQRVLTESLG
jgi:sugar phosphate isomerase/epimerase